MAAALLLLCIQWLPILELSPHLLDSLRVMAKLAAAALALAISLLTWNTRRVQPLNFVFAGFSFFSVAVLAAVQIVMLPGMPGLAAAPDVGVANALQLAADASSVAGLFAAALGPSRAGSSAALRAGVAASVAWIAASIGLSTLAPSWTHWSELAALRSELATACAALIAVPLLLRRKQHGTTGFVLLALAASLGAIGVGGTAGLSQTQVPDCILDDAYKVLACLLVYAAMFREGVLAPWNRLVENGRAVDQDRRRFKQLFESAPDGLLLIDARGRILHANPAAGSLFGWPVNELTGQAVEVLIPVSRRANHSAMRTQYQAKPQPREMGRGGPLIAVRRDGCNFPVEIALAPQESGDGWTTLCIVRDVTERRRLEKTLLRQALHDSLTELPNRRYFRDSVSTALARAELNGAGLTLMFIDLDNFKQVNDSFGHSEGDALLCEVARRLSETLRADDLLARMGGDEFALLLAGAQPADAAAVAGKVLAALEPEFSRGPQALKIGASIGITLYPTDGKNVEELLGNADLAMYRAKQRGRNSWCFFEPRMTERLRERAALQHDLSHAVERGQLELAYQPRVDAVDGGLTGFEALLRWHHPARGKVPPDEFIGLAEESGLIVSIGEWVLREACAQAARWRAAGAGRLTIAVNVSTHQLRHAGFASSVQQVLLDTGWPAEQLELEITETALMEDPAEATAVLNSIHTLGVRFAVDDFGTGYSSLAYLKAFPLHRLKVDRSFVQGLHAEGSDRVIASSIIALAHALGLQVTAEGVETEAQRDFLLQRDCDELQGYLFSAPVSASDCEALLRAECQRLTRPQPKASIQEGAHV
ncbi:MAG: EAL domain-containing protein [Paucibacter sp.]|nr:EAL domain-containing protein [Roseateles sp.]